jgi:hypothetical protein
MVDGCIALSTAISSFMRHHEPVIRRWARPQAATA